MSERPILIAECCQNHNGSREVLKRMIHEATAAGADYVKIQAIRSRELTIRERFETGAVDDDGTVRVIKRPYAPEYERLEKLDLTLDDEGWFVEECWRAGVAPMTTVFTRSGAREVSALGWEAVKIASYDCRSYPLLREVRDWCRRLFVSTGATFDEEIERAAEVLSGAEVTFLHCVTLYPTPLPQLHLRRMSFLRRFAPRVGYSDHSKPATDGLWPSSIALALGADCVERHFTVLPAGETKDGPVSIGPSDLAALRAFADRPRPERMEIVAREFPGWEAALGQATRALSHEELLNRDYYCGRFAAKFEGREVFNWQDEALDQEHAAPRP